MSYTRVTYHQKIYIRKLKNIFTKKTRGVNIVLQNLVSALILDHLHGNRRRVNKIMLQIDKVGELASEDLTCYVLTVEDAVLRIY